MTTHDQRFEAIAAELQAMQADATRPARITAELADAPTAEIPAALPTQPLNREGAIRIAARHEREAAKHQHEIGRQRRLLANAQMRRLMVAA